jgi:hypothetical protein
VGGDGGLAALVGGDEELALLEGGLKGRWVSAIA